MSAAVHLHARGDARLLFTLYLLTDGSPPRAWRRCLYRSLSYRMTRFTSTRVETLVRLPNFRPTAAVHLHARGDAINPASPTTEGVGSPPRAWRRFPERQPYHHRPRFTSTRVETLSRISRTVLGDAVHLHARGDADPMQLVQMMQHGSPPRAWRRFLYRFNSIAQTRFTSTRVETLRTIGVSPVSSTVHLHARGDAAAKKR